MMHLEMNKFGEVAKEKTGGESWYPRQKQEARHGIQGQNRWRAMVSKDKNSWSAMVSKDKNRWRAMVSKTKIGGAPWYPTSSETIL
ncbi:hypothetical protein ElyMa_000722300 [Elysia marginata]|uniref:Uncharacterized protein n=1 Tax=Elysia marginata TaxID=1093978 RepID=A0AAV4GNB3_9GAST|nr:hypothetical protein ElyMa_000722300 [Elysia marginata]